MKRCILCLILWTGLGAAQDRILVGTDFQLLKTMLASLAKAKSAEVAHSYAARIGGRFGGYCVLNSDPEGEVKQRTRSEFDSSAEEVLLKMVAGWNRCPEPMKTHAPEPDRPESRVNFPRDNAKWTQLNVKIVRFLCLSARGKSILAGSVAGICYSSTASAPWDCTRGDYAEAQTIEAVALTDHEAFAGGVTTGIRSPLYAALLGPLRLRWRSVDLRRREVRALAASDRGLFASTEEGVYILPPPYFEGDPGQEQRLSSSPGPDKLSADIPFLVQTAQTGTVGEPAGPMVVPVGAERNQRAVYPVRRNDKVGWFPISDNNLRSDAVITALAADGSHVFAGTLDGKVYELCPTKGSGSDSWVEFKGSPFKGEIIAIAAGGGRIYISDGWQIVSGSENNCESQDTAWEPMTGNLSPHINALAYSDSNKLLFAGTSSDIWSAPAVTPPPKVPPGKAAAK